MSGLHERDGDISPVEFARLHEADQNIFPHGMTHIRRWGPNGNLEYVMFNGFQHLTEDIPFLPYDKAEAARREADYHALVNFHLVRRQAKRIEELEAELEKVRASQPGPALLDRWQAEFDYGWPRWNKELQQFEFYVSASFDMGGPVRPTDIDPPEPIVVEQWVLHKDLVGVMEYALALIDSVRSGAYFCSSEASA